jgi:hypothetical protein
MLRLTREVFVDLSIWMIGFGLLIGLVFPFFALSLGIPFTGAYNRHFGMARLREESGRAQPRGRRLRTHSPRPCERI